MSQYSLSVLCHFVALADCIRFIYLFNISWPVRRLPINMRGQVIANHGKLKGKKKKDAVREGKEIGREKEREAH